MFVIHYIFVDDSNAILRKGMRLINIRILQTHPIQTMQNHILQDHLSQIP